MLLYIELNAVLKGHYNEVLVSNCTSNILKGKRTIFEASDCHRM